MKRRMALQPTDLTTGDALFYLEREGQLYSWCIGAVFSELGPGEMFFLDTITIHKDGTVTVTYSKGDRCGETMPTEKHTVVFKPFRDGEEAKKYHKQKMKEWDRRTKIIRDFCNTFNQAFAGKRQHKK